MKRGKKEMQGKRMCILEKFFNEYESEREKEREGGGSKSYRKEKEIKKRED